jgi:hypothetical protein
MFRKSHGVAMFCLCMHEHTGTQRLVTPCSKASCNPCNIDAMVVCWLREHTRRCIHQASGPSCLHTYPRQRELLHKCSRLTCLLACDSCHACEHVLFPYTRPQQSTIVPAYNFKSMMIHCRPVCCCTLPWTAVVCCQLTGTGKLKHQNSTQHQPLVHPWLQLLCQHTAWLCKATVVSVNHHT